MLTDGSRRWSLTSGFHVELTGGISDAPGSALLICTPDGSEAVGIVPGVRGSTNPRGRLGSNLIGAILSAGRWELDVLGATNAGMVMVCGEWLLL